MKKFIIFLLVLIIIGGVLFSIGWLQFRIERNEIGVVHTKTVGYLDRPVLPGEFFWTPWNLIPTNMELIRVPSHPVTVRISHKGTLPSGDLYSYYIQGHPDFSYSIDLSVVFSIHPDRAVFLVKHENLSSDTYPQWIEHKRKSLEQQAVRLVLAKITDIAQESAASGMSLADVSSSTIKDDLERSFRELIIHDITIDSISLPDLELYIRARQSYYSALEKQQAQLEEVLEERSADRAELELYIQKLEKYGRLFTQYPALLEYLELHPLESLP